MDKYLLSCLHKFTTKIIKQGYEVLDYNLVYSLSLQFVKEMTDVYLPILSTRIQGEVIEDKISAQYTLSVILEVLSKILEPVVPNLVDEIRRSCPVLQLREEENPLPSTEETLNAEEKKHGHRLRNCKNSL